MAIVDTDIKLMLSITSGAAGDSAAQSDPNAALGKYISTTDASASVNALFDAVSGAENAASDVEYRCVFVKNAHATLTLLGTVVYMTAPVAGGAAAAIGLDTTAKSDADSASAQALTIADESTAPAGVTFSTTAVDVASGLSIGDLAPDEVKGIWIRRTAANTAAVDDDGFSLNVTGDTQA